jgi:hypothetical protein
MHVRLDVLRRNEPDGMAYFRQASEPNDGRWSRPLPQVYYRSRVSVAIIAVSRERALAADRRFEASEA